MFKHFLIILLFSCSTQKKTFTETEVKKKEINVDSLVKSKTDSVRTVYEEALKEMTAGVDFVVNNNDSICREVQRQLQNDVLNNREKTDSLLIALRNAVAPVNKVIIKSSGEMEYSGQIKSFNIKLSDWQKKYDSLKVSKDSELNVQKKIVDSLGHTITKVDKKTKIKGFGWFWFLIGFAIATFIWKRTQIISYLRK